MITAERLRELLHYDPETGEWTWARPQKASHMKPGDRAGSFFVQGYRGIMIDGRRYKEHRLAFLYMTDDWPPGSIDHINLDKADNRWSNLRVATRSQNRANQPADKTNKLKLKGVCRLRRAFLAQITVNGKKTCLGLFDCPAAAHFAYVVAADKAHGEYARFW